MTKAERKTWWAFLLFSGAFFCWVYGPSLDRPGAFIDEGVLPSRWMAAEAAGEGWAWPGFWREKPYKGAIRGWAMRPLFALLGWELWVYRLASVLALFLALAIALRGAFRAFGTYPAMAAGALLMSSPALFLWGRHDFSNLPWLLALGSYCLFGFQKTETKDVVRENVLLGFAGALAVWAHSLAIFPLLFALLWGGRRKALSRCGAASFWGGVALGALPIVFSFDVSTLSGLFGEAFRPERGTPLAFGDRVILLGEVLNGLAAVKFLTWDPVLLFKRLPLALHSGALLFLLSGRSGKESQQLARAFSLVMVLFLLFPPTNRPHHVLLALFPFVMLPAAVAFGTLWNRGGRERVLGALTMATLLVSQGMVTLQMKRLIETDRVRSWVSYSGKKTLSDTLAGEGRIWPLVHFLDADTAFVLGTQGRMVGTGEAWELPQEDWKDVDGDYFLVTVKAAGDSLIPGEEQELERKQRLLRVGAEKGFSFERTLIRPASASTPWLLVLRAKRSP